MNVSVCMASYNGAKYIQEQIYSVLDNLDNDDELIIIDDCSNDGTVDIVKRINDSKIKLYVNKVNQGVNYSFNKALSLSKNQYIFLCDQDDIWISNRVEMMKNALNEYNVLLVTSNSDFVDSIGNKIQYNVYEKKASDSKKNIKNILNIFYGIGNYPGCAMAFKRELLNLVLPFPSYIESHDLWIAKAANILRSNYHLEFVTFRRRIHGLNVSIIQRNFLAKIQARIIFLLSVFHIIFRRLKIFLNKTLMFYHR